MNQLDIYFRALIEYRKLTGANIECSAFLSAASEADRPTDRIVAVRNICTIDEDWVNEIEKGLDFIEKAIKEERQFILSQGEVVPIEKVKNFSKESVKHLAKHAELITREQDDDEIVPDSLYTVERLNDYKVYEGPDAIQQPAGRVGNPPDIANMVLYLCSDMAGFITGENICIDGGMTRQMIYHDDHGWKLEM